MTLIFTSGAVTDLGQVREHNEDRVLLSDALFVVADGMGGHEHGEIASSIVVQVFGSLAHQASVTGVDMSDCLEEARNKVGDLAGHDARPAGTTVTAVGIEQQDDEAFWHVLNLGDSRTYLWRKSVAPQLTRVSMDHSMVQDLINSGALDEQSARVHPYKHVVTRALGGGEETSAADQFIEHIEPGDVIMLCSDGLSDELDDVTIASLIAAGGHPQDIAQHLTDAANLSGGHDNISVIVVRAEEATETQ